MMTVENLGIEYEPPQGKWALVLPKIAILVADNLTVHSELLVKIKDDITNSPHITVAQVAEAYATSLRELKARRAEQYVLSLYRLSSDTFIQRQREMDPNLVVQYAQQMEDYQANIKAQALIVGINEDNTAHIYYMDNNGINHCYNDTGFASIGIGSEHANSQFMMRGHSNGAMYYQALLMTFLAKKSAEIAPGVGKNTDMLLITRQGASKITDTRIAALQKTYDNYIQNRDRLEKRVVEQFAKIDQKITEEEKTKKQS